MIKFLKKPYPFNFDIIHNAKIIFLISILISLFIYFFQPFKIGELPSRNIFIISSITGLITFAILGFNMLVLPSYLSKVFDSDKWIIFKEIIWDSWLFISLIASYFLYFKFAKIYALSGLDFVKIMLISIFPIAILVVLNQNRLLKLNLNDAIELNKKILSKIKSGEEVINFESEYKSDSIQLKANSIILIKSANNYIEIFWLDKLKINKHIIRMKFNLAEEMLKSYNFIFKCHRVYIVNTNYVKEAKANPQGVKLLVEYLDFEIPVSKTYMNKLKEII